MLHIIVQKYTAELEQADKEFWTIHENAKASENKVEAYSKEHQYRLAVLQKIPRTCCGAQSAQIQSVLGMFLSYDASKGRKNQEIKAVDMVLDFKPEHSFTSMDQAPHRGTQQQSTPRARRPPLYPGCVGGV